MFRNFDQVASYFAAVAAVWVIAVGAKGCNDAEFNTIQTAISRGCTVRHEEHAGMQYVCPPVATK